jgi:hypothetical protein
MRRIALAAIATLALVGVVLAEDMNVAITKIDATNNKIEYKKVTGKGKDAKVEDEVHKADISKTVKVVKGKFDPDAKKLVDGDAIEGGLKAEMLATIPADAPVRAMMTIADDGADKGKVTKITIFGGKKKN